MKSPFALLTLGLLVILIALCFTFPTEAAPPTVSWQTIYGRYNGTVYTIGSGFDRLECWGYSGWLDRQALPMRRLPNDQWQIGLYAPYDYVLFCQGYGIDALPFVAEDHDNGDDAMLILDSINSDHVVVNRDRAGLWHPDEVLAVCPLGDWQTSVVVPLLVGAEWFGDPGDGGPRWQYGVQVPDGCEIEAIVYGRRHVP